MKNYTGSDLGQEFKDFYKAEKKRIKTALTKLGCTDVEMSMQFNYFNGFFTGPTGQTWYFSCSDVRHFGYTKLLYRTAKDRKDWTGGSNCYVSTDNLKEMRLS